MSGTWDAATYDQVATPHVAWGQEVVGRLALDGSEVVLDAGCGTGRVTELVLTRAPGVRLVALDASVDMIHEARRRLAPWGGRVSFVVGDLRQGLPGPVDAVLSTATFHWIHDHDRLFANLARALPAGGQLVAQCGGAGNIAGVRRALAELGARVDDARFPTPEQTAAALARAGFDGARCWLQAAPTTFASLEELERFLATVILRHQLAEVAAPDRPAFVREVATRLPDRRIDYVRLNITARRGGDPRASPGRPGPGRCG
ncbi:MAG TPA: methyltransferase domain-containing protein [Acidimicrobiales bacterium]|nr:methyltransferase domain-containing protein [Acidimicrobiales bacterium]